MWEIPELWKGECVYIIGGGPSLIGQDICLPPRNGRYGLEAYLHDKHVIGVNSSFYFGDWVDICFFGDAKWYWWHKDELQKFNGLKITCNITANGRDCSVLGEKKIKIIEFQKGHGLSITGKVWWNASSGGCAVDLANRFGAKRIILLGYDMRNCLLNTEYQNLGGKNFLPHTQWMKTKPDPFINFSKPFYTIAEKADKYGVEILNSTPDSSLTMFKRVRLEDIA